MRTVTLLVCLIATLGLVVSASGEGLPSSKATADINTLVKCNMSTATNEEGMQVPLSCVDLFSGAAVPVAADSYVTIAEKSVKLSNSQSLFVSPSLVTGLYTRTRTKTTTGSTSTAQAMGGVYLRAVLVDAAGKEIAAAPLTACDGGILGCVAPPGTSEYGVMLDSRVQTLTQELSACVVDVAGVAGTCTFTSILDLVLQTTSAHTFNFVFPNVGQGTYTLKVKAAVASGASIIAGSGTAVGAAAFGVGSVTAESVRLVHDFQF